jgi:solute carrier family 36 (proton-coupled amino acid transporter)
MVNFLPDWLKHIHENVEINRRRRELNEISEQAAKVAAERAALKQDYGAIAEEAADAALARIEIKEGIQAAGEEVAAIFAGRTSTKQTVFHLLKGNIGPGCLSLPWAFSQLGIPLGVVMTFLVGFWTYYNCIILLDVKARQTSNRRTVTYSDLGEVAFGKTFRGFVTSSIVLLQMAICTVFLSFCSNNTQAFFHNYVPGVEVLGASKALNIMLILPIAIFLTLLPSLHALGPVSEIAIIILVSAFGILGVVLALNFDQRPTEMPTIDWVKVPMAVSGILYSFEGICIVLPLDATMRNRQRFIPIFTQAYVIITIIYAVIGASCVYVLGFVDDGSITAFLSSHPDKYKGDLLVTIANLLVSAAVIATYALTMFPCIELWCQAQERKARGDTLESDISEEDWWGGSLAYGPFDTPALRLSLIACTVIAAIAVPDVKQLIGLAGAVAGAVTALIFPPLLALHFELLERPEMSWCKIEKFLLLSVGIVFGIFGTAAAIYDIYKSFS